MKILPANIEQQIDRVDRQKSLAIAELESVLKSFPNPRLRRRVDELKKN